MQQPLNDDDDVSLATNSPRASLIKRFGDKFNIRYIYEFMLMCASPCISDLWKRLN